MVACASAHRGEAFEACHFLIDWLKTKAPFWKLEETASGSKWVEAIDADKDAAHRWSISEVECCQDNLVPLDIGLPFRYSVADITFSPLFANAISEDSLDRTKW